MFDSMYSTIIDVLIKILKAYQALDSITTVAEEERFFTL